MSFALSGCGKTLSTACSPSQWFEFLTISNHCEPRINEPNGDFYVGREIKCDLTLKNGSLTKVKDVVVLGKLIIRSEQHSLDNRPALHLRNSIIVGQLEQKNTIYKGDTEVIYENEENFRNDLTFLICEWLKIQRDSVNKIGLKSVLV